MVMTMVGCILAGHAQTAKEMYEAQQYMKPNNYSDFSIGKGTRFVSGSVGLSFGSVSTYCYYGTTSEFISKPNPIEISLSGGFGSFFSDKWTIGVELEYAHNTTPISQLGTGWLKQYTNLFGIAIEVTEHLKITDNFFYTAGLSFGGLIGDLKEDVDYTNYMSFQVNGIALQGYLLAFEFRPTNRLAMNVGVGYYVFEFMRLKNTDMKMEVWGSDYKLGNATIGVSYYF